MLGFALDGDAAEPRHRQLYAQLRTAILTRRLAPGARLPSSRLFASELGCARGTVLLAFDQLIAEGYVRSAGGSGTFVADELPDDFLSVQGVRHRAAERAGRAAPPLLSRRANTLLALAARPNAAPLGTPFTVGQPALDHFPFEIWAKLLAEAWRRPDPAMLGAFHPAGHPRLRQAIADYLRAARGLDCRPDEVIVTAGTQHAISLVARLILDPGDPVWLEEPCYPGLRATLTAAGARSVPVIVDSDGLSVAAGRRADRTWSWRMCPRVPGKSPGGIPRRASTGNRACWRIRVERWIFPTPPILRHAAFVLTRSP